MTLKFDATVKKKPILPQTKKRLDSFGSLFKIEFEFKQDQLWEEGFYYIEEEKDLEAYLKAIKEQTQVRNMKIYRAPFNGWELLEEL